RLDNIKNFLSLRGVPKPLQKKVINWFDYLWFSNNINISDENQIIDDLPDKLKIEIAIHVHLDTLKRVEIFQNTEEGFLSELVVRLRSQLYSPGDFICRKGQHISSDMDDPVIPEECSDHDEHSCGITGSSSQYSSSESKFETNSKNL
ncbi:hypothetical protein Ciccas_011360, partial [Cichlidogyrus casuarinus]